MARGGGKEGGSGAEGDISFDPKSWAGEPAPVVAEATFDPKSWTTRPDPDALPAAPPPPLRRKPPRRALIAAGLSALVLIGGGLGAPKRDVALMAANTARTL